MTLWCAANRHAVVRQVQLWSARKASPGKKWPGSGKKKGRAAGNAELAGQYELFDADGVKIDYGFRV